MRKFWTRWWWGVMVCLMVGCSLTYPGEAYVEADEATYKYAQPKLEEWAARKKAEGDPDWEPIVKNKGISWKARITRAKSRPNKEEEQ